MAAQHVLQLLADAAAGGWQASGVGPRNFVDAYDCEKCEPKQGLMDDYNRVKDELRAMGLKAL